MAEGHSQQQNRQLILLAQVSSTKTRSLVEAVRRMADQQQQTHSHDREQSFGMFGLEELGGSGQTGRVGTHLSVSERGRGAGRRGPLGRVHSVHFAVDWPWVCILTNSM